MHIEEARDRELIALRTSLKNERDELAKASAQVARDKDLLTSTVAKAVEDTAKQERVLHAKELSTATRNARAHEKEKLKKFSRRLLEQHVSLEHARGVLAVSELELQQEKAGLRKSTVAAVAAVTKRERVLRVKAVADASHRARAEEQAKHRREIHELTRRLDAAKARKTLSHVGIEADAKLAELLKAQFPGDVIVPTRGSRTGDVLHTVRYSGRDAGLILWERKTGARITKAFVTKLRSDVLKRQADYGILVGDGYYKKGFFGCDVDGNVAVINAHMIRPIADLLRKSLIAMHLSGIAANSRMGVANKLLAYVTSGDFRRRMTRFVEMAEALLRLHDTDKIYHSQYWKQIEVICREYQVSSADIDAGLNKAIAGLPPECAA